MLGSVGCERRANAGVNHFYLPVQQLLKTIIDCGNFSTGYHLPQQHMQQQHFSGVSFSKL